MKPPWFCEEVEMDTIFEPKPRAWKRVLVLLLQAVPILLAVTSAFWTTPASASSAQRKSNRLLPVVNQPALPRSSSYWFEAVLAPDAKPAKGWVICKNLGIGPVPGLLDSRQRFKLCHPSGWEVKTYCTFPNYPAPRLGATCTRSGDLYTCGSGVQQLREYGLIATPPASTATPPVATATPIATATPSLTATTTPAAPTPGSPTSTPVHRPRPGGPGNTEDIAIFLVLEGVIIVLVGAGAILLVNKLRGKS
jgi:hypothetical protein